MMETVFGEKYLVKYQIPGLQRVPRYGLATLIGAQNNEYIFSGRPEFGTTGLRKEWIIEMTLVPANDSRKPFIDRRTA